MVIWWLGKGVKSVDFYYIYIGTISVVIGNKKNYRDKHDCVLFNLDTLYIICVKIILIINE